MTKMTDIFFGSESGFHRLKPLKVISSFFTLAQKGGHYLSDWVQPNLHSSKTDSAETVHAENFYHFDIPLETCLKSFHHFCLSISTLFNQPCSLCSGFHAREKWYKGQILVQRKPLGRSHIYKSSFRHLHSACTSVSCESGYWKFEKWKWKKFSFTFCSRSEKWNENLIHSFREWKVKYKCLEIEIESEKWNENASRSRARSEISREFSRNSWELRKNWFTHCAFPSVSSNCISEWMQFCTGCI